uniref:Uncharacterized protein n=1 Tax=Globodera rostochiensis TaxID=31243 RepID=A0A914HTN6_GLORO
MKLYRMTPPKICMPKKRLRSLKTKQCKQIEWKAQPVLRLSRTKPSKCEHPSKCRAKPYKALKMRATEQMPSEPDKPLKKGEEN